MRTLSNDALLLVAERLGVQTLPPVLAVGPRQDSYDSWEVARCRALTDLSAEGVFDEHGEVEGELADALYTLAQPEGELAARIYSADRCTRVSISYRPPHHAVAVRRGDRYEIGLFWADGSPETLSVPLLSALGASRAAEVPGFSSPTVDLAARLGAVRQPGDYADALYSLGMPADDAVRLGSALGSCYGFAEIVAYSYRDGTTTRAPGTVAVYETGRGRITAAPTISPDQQIWSTVTTGSDHRVARAIATLLEGLPGGGWPMS